ncbi:MAG TPA: CADD family putative folate metabolism protein [Rhabdochlamydiaceae bacterium]|jgi:pyrroloquinoline-quinone synthase
MNFCDAALQALDQQIADKHLLKHDFYRAWSEGKLSKECLKEYAIEYYHHVKAFPTYLSALHAHTEDMPTRKSLLQNLIEEEAGSPNHPDLWKTFALSLGANEDEITQHTPSASIQHLIHTFRSICKEEGVAEGLSALYAYESQIPAICISKITGLKEHYGMNDPAHFRYFTIHIAADQEHARVERELLSQHISLERAESVHRAAERILDALWNFLSHMTYKYQIAC